MFDLIDQGRGLFILGNHDFMLARAIGGQITRVDAILTATLGHWMNPCGNERCGRSCGRQPGFGMAVFGCVSIHNPSATHGK